MTLPAGDIDWTNLDDDTLDRIVADPELTAVYVANLRAEAEDLAHRVGWDRWRLQARPEQVPPPGRWRVWYLQGGRGAGKTWTGANAFAEMIRRYPVDEEGNPTEWGVVAPTIADARDTCMENSRSGLLRALGLSRNYKGWNRSQGQLRLPSGQIVYTGAADDGADRMQGKNLSGCWCDEVGLWERWETAWREGVQMTVRVAPARIIVTGTPKADRAARKLVRMLLDDDTVPKSVLLTRDNAANLDPQALAEFQRLEGTRLGRQELEGALLEDVEGALWSREMLDHTRREPEQAPQMDLVVVAVDPAGTVSDTSAETGIVAAGRGDDGEVYVFGDASLKGSPLEWSRQAWLLWRDLGADLMLIEDNFGKDMAEETLRAGWAALVSEGRLPRSMLPPIRRINAGPGKRSRAEPIVALFEQNRAHIVGELVDLETQLREWSGGSPSPDRLDAMVHAINALILQPAAAGARPVSRGARLAGRR